MLRWIVDYSVLKSLGRMILFDFLTIYCAGDPLPVLDILDADNFPSFMDMVLRIVNTSISSCNFPDCEK